MARIVKCTRYDDCDWIVFDPLPIVQTRQIDEQQTIAEYEVRQYMDSHVRAHILVDLSSVTWSTVMHLFRITTKSQRTRGIDLFKALPTDAVRIKMKDNSLKWFVEKCIALYVSPKIRGRIQFIKESPF